MALLRRRSFVLALVAASPLAACAPTVVAARRPRSGAVVRAGRDRHERPLTVFGGLHLAAKVSPGDTAGDLYIIEHADEARGGPPRHVHHAQDEWFYVLAGTYRLDVGEERFELVAGDSAFAPRGVPHVWAHTGAGTGRLLLAFQPAGQMEPFFAALAQQGSAPTPEALAPLFRAHGMTVLGPPLAV